MIGGWVLMGSLRFFRSIGRDTAVVSGEREGFADTDGPELMLTLSDEYR